MLENPILKPCYGAECIDTDHVLLISEKDNVLLTGKLYNLVLSEICGSTLSLAEVVDRLRGKLSEMEIYLALESLEKKGYITEAAPALPPETSAYWSSQGMEINRFLTVLQEKTITLTSVGSLATELFSQAFALTGLKCSETGALHVYITDDYQRHQFATINQDALKTGQPWMLVKPVGVELWVGPIFLPGQTGCWECLKQRLDMNRPVDAFYKTQKNTRHHLSLPAAFSPLSWQIAANMTALEITKWLYAGHNERLDGKLISFDTATMNTQSHVLVKRPQCSSCGEPGYLRAESLPIIPVRRSSCSVTALGGYREVDPEATIEKYQHHVSPITGVMPKLEPYYHVKGTPLYNYSSGRNIALRSKSLFWLNQHLRSGNGGKGKNWTQAKVGALCEAVERYCFTYHGDEPHITTSLKNLDGKGIHPNTCMNFSDTQYQNRVESNRNCGKFYSMVPIPFDSAREMDWTAVYSLTHQMFKYLPSCFCYAQYPAEDELNLFSYPDSNGCAAGNSIEEAILQGFLELVERDAVALWWYNMPRRTAVDLSSFNEPYFLQLIDYYQSLQRSLYVLDLTSDLNIPTFGAVSHQLDGGTQDIIFGFGSHVDARIALERALVELNQLLPIVDGPEVDRAKGKYLTQDNNFLHWLKTATMENQPYLAPQQDIAPKTATDYPQLCEPTIYDSLMFCVNTAAQHGLETLVLDLTRPDIGLSVVKIVVPGLRHFWQRLAPGRLYDVPVQIGWLATPLHEAQLNPMPLFI